VSAEQLLSMAMSIVAAEELAREVARGVKVEVSVESQKPRETKIIRLTDVEPGTIISEAGPGRLVELVAVSNTSSYELTVIVDGRIASSGLFTWYQSISQYSDWIDAFEDDGTFVLRISDVSFSTGISVYFRPTASAPKGLKLSEVVAKIEKI